MKRHATLTTIVFAALLLTPAFATTFYVDAARPDDAGDGLAWATAKQTIQAAVDLALTNDTVLVTNGVYATGESVTPGYACSNRVVITKDIIVQSVNGPAATVIYGQGPLGDSAVRCVYMSRGTLVGFTLTNGSTKTSGNIYYDRRGGGVNMQDGNGIVSNCIISGNSAVWGGGTNTGTVNNCTISANSASYGGGMHVGTVNNCTISGNSATIGGGTYAGTVNNCTISGNSASSGGGTYAGTVNNCTISGNSAVSYGGGTSACTVNNCTISGNSATLGGGTYAGTVNNCTISANTANDQGGGMYGSTVNNCMISRNSANGDGGGTYRATVNNCTISGNSANGGGGTRYGTINNCTISRNTANHYGGGTYGGSARNAIVWNNTAPQGSNYFESALAYSCTTPAAAGTGNITNDPDLVNSSLINFSSPCLGAGSSSYATGWDIDGEPWRNPPAMGCDEVYPNGLTGTLTVTISAPRTTELVNATLTFSSLIDGRPTSNRWTFGDGSASANKICTQHAWTSPGQYNVIVAAFNADNPAGVAATVRVTTVTLDQVTFYVNLANSAPSYPYQTWATAATNIQDAVDAAEATDINGARVIVTNGVYESSTRVTPGFVCPNRVVITKNIIVQSVNGAAATIILGQGPQGNSAVRCVYMSAGTLVGFTLTNGSTWTSGHDYYDRSGGGVNMYGGNGMVCNCTISGNSANTYGGGTYASTISNCTISANSAGASGGGTSGGMVNNCTISGNTTVLNGGGLHACTVNNSTISANSASYGGGTDYCMVNNCTISANVASSGGGTYGSTMLNSIVWNNTAPQGSNYYISALAYSCTTPAAPGTGNITNDPLLVSSSRINVASPCLGAGSNSHATGWDIDGEAWRNPPAMGCDEVYQNGLTGTLTVAISAPRTTELVNAALTFSALIDGRPASNRWTFGDGSATANKICTQHAWTSPGHYNVIIAAFNEDNPAGVAATADVTIVALDQATFYVNLANPVPGYPYQTWATAATNIQDAVDAADMSEMTGARVMVTNGVYATGTRVTPGFACSNRVVITKDIIVQSVNGAAATIIQGQGPPGDSAVRCVYMSAGILVGFTLTNGSTCTSGNYDYDCSGGGVCMYGGNGMASNCLISGNAAYSGGGTCYGTVINCMISGNSAEYGGGTFFGTVSNCTISRNSASSGGGGTYGSTVNNCTFSVNSAHEGGGTYAGVINNCAINGNSASFQGGGTSAGTVNNCTISGNSANSGGGTYAGTVNNCTISGNSANGDGGGTHSSSVRNSIVWNNTAPQSSNYYNATLAYSCTIPLAPGTGNITNDPLLVNSAHINFLSACIGTGSNGYATGRDIDGEPWRNPPAMGCDEVYPNGLTGALTVAISAPRTTNLVGAMLAFSAVIDGRPASNYWSFGDGSAIADEIGVQHSWSATGQYWVILAAFNADNPAGVAATVRVMIVTLDQITFYVNTANTVPSYPYQTWTTAATNIQDAVEAAEATEITGARVMVTNGTYATGGRVTPGFACSNRVLITKNIIVQSVCGPAATIIQGRGPLGDNAIRCVYMSAGTLVGFTLTNGSTRTSVIWDYELCGGGVNMYGGSGMVSNCLISGNAAEDLGGGVYAGTVNNCTINGNTAYSGGGTSGGTVNNCTISGNAASYYGGGTYAGTINNCTISGNAADRSGGGTSAGTVNNCTISGNAADWDGGGTSGGTLNNCTISGNAAKQRGGGVYYGAVINSIVWENTAPTSNNMFNSSAAYTCSDPRPAGIWNICADPLFVNTNAGDYRLQEGSPCINAGTNLPWMAGATDLDGNPRIIDGRVDMGAYEFVPEPALIRQVVLIALATLGRKLRVRQT